jgi:hypothetical protein
VSAILVKLYPKEENNIQGYQTVFEKLMMIPSVVNDMAIVLTNEKDDFDGEEYVDVSGEYKHPKNKEEEYSHAIEFTPWKKWLGMDISTESLKDFTELEILAHCLYEMTFVGFDEKDIKEELEDLERTVEDYGIMTEEEKHKKTTSLNEFLDELKEDEQENENTQ